MVEDYDDYDYEYIEGTPWCAGYYHVWDGLVDAYGHTLDEAIDELHRNIATRCEEGT